MAVTLFLALGVVMIKSSVPKFVAVLTAALALGFSTVLVVSAPSRSDVPNPAVTEPFTAPRCAGRTLEDPTANEGYSVADLTQVFGARLESYNAGSPVPLYDSYGGSILLDEDDQVVANEAGYPFAAFPPLCATRYVEELGTAVSEWMFCTDLDSQSCGDTNSEGYLVDNEGTPISRMTALTGNSRLTADQERLIAYLIQHGHPYDGVGDQAWNGVTQARADLGSYERAALQTLVWCISDPIDDPDSDFSATCENSMNAAEQERVLQMIPDTPEMVLTFDSVIDHLAPGVPAEFRLSTNVVNQPISLTLGGTADVVWTVCSGSASIAGSTLTVDGDNPNALVEVTLCATASNTGTATIDVSATPASTEHIGWAQSVNPGLDPPCQVYATFEEVNMVAVSASAAVVFEANDEPDPTPTPEPTPEPEPSPVPVSEPTPEPSPNPSIEPTPEAVPSPAATPTPGANITDTPTPGDGGLATSGLTTGLTPLWLGIALLTLGGAAVAVRKRLE